MYKIILKIDGMKCSMCEAHINDLIRKNFKIKKVNSSHKKNEALIFSEEIISLESLNKAFDDSGYLINNYEIGQATKTLLGWK